MLKFATPKRKTITTKDGKTETREYQNVLKGAALTLFKGQESDVDCCGSKQPVGSAATTKFGRFEFPDLQPGWYWLRVHSGDFAATIPVHLTAAADAKLCRDPSVGRIITVDSKPPSVETHIY